MQAWLERSARPGAKLRLGELALAAGVPCLADAGGFDRHTFLCGQSGSGKTYSLGVILERLLIEMDLRLVILDPNSDFVRVGNVRRGADPALAERYQEAARGAAVYSADAPGERRLRLHAAEIDPVTQAAVLRLDPIADREEYAALADLLTSPSQSALAALSDSDRPEARRLGLRVRNLGVDRYTVWAPGETGSVLDAVPRSGHALCRHRPGLAPDARGAVTDRRRGPRRPVAPTARAQAGTDRDRRGAQRTTRGGPRR